MKTLQILFFFTIITFLSCGDDDNNIPDTNPNELKVTAWKGMIFEHSQGELVGHGPITLQFTTETRGNYEYKYDYQTNEILENFEYKVVDKLMQIKAVSAETSTSLKGDWIIQKLDGDSLVLSKNAPMDEAISNFIKVKKVKS